MMRRFSPEDRRDMVGDNGRIGITCEFCSRFYDLDPAEVEAEIAKSDQRISMTKVGPLLINAMHMR